MQTTAELVGYVVIGSLLSGIGALAELNSLQYLESGQTVLALWLAGVGALMLYAGVYMIGYEKILQRVQNHA